MDRRSQIPKILQSSVDSMSDSEEYNSVMGSLNPSSVFKSTLKQPSSSMNRSRGLSRSKSQTLMRHKPKVPSLNFNFTRTNTHSWSQLDPKELKHNLKLKI